MQSLEGSVKFEWFSRDSPEFLKALIKISAVCTLDVGDSPKLRSRIPCLNFHTASEKLWPFFILVLQNSQYCLSLAELNKNQGSLEGHRCPALGWQELVY